MQSEETIQRRQLDLATRGLVRRAGASKRPLSRKRDNERKYFKGKILSKYTFLFAPTKDMRKAENRLLNICNKNENCPLNLQRKSNLPRKKKGYVYVICKTA